MRAFGTKDSDMPEKVSQKSGTLYTEGGVGNSPVKGWFRDKLKAIKDKVTGGGGAGPAAQLQQTAAAAGGA